MRRQQNVFLTRNFVAASIQIPGRREWRVRREPPVLRRLQRFNCHIDNLIRPLGRTHIDQLGKPPRSNGGLNLRNQFWKRCKVRDCCRTELSGLSETLVNRREIILRRKLRLFRVNRADPIGKGFLPRNFATQARVIQVAMGIDQAGQQRLLAKIDNFSPVARLDLVEPSNVDNPIPFNCNRAILDRRDIHRDNDTRVDNHSFFTTFRHWPTSRLHASWQSIGTSCFPCPI